MNIKIYIFSNRIGTLPVKEPSFLVQHLYVATLATPTIKAWIKKRILKYLTIN